MEILNESAQHTNSSGSHPVKQGIQEKALPNWKYVDIVEEFSLLPINA